MANALERLAQAGTNSVGAYTFVDADTLRDSDGQLLRLQGYDAPEIAGFKGGNWTGGTAGGAAATTAITSLAEKHGFSNVVPALDENGDPLKDPHGRPIVRMRNDQGEDFTTKLLESGILKSGKYTTQEDLDAIAVAKLFKTEADDQTEWGQAASVVADGIKKEAGEDLYFKQSAINEAQFAAAPWAFTSAVQFRKPDRDIRNSALNPFSDSWEQGWIGVKEASYGVLNLIGETTDAEWAAEVGEAGVNRARKQLSEYGTTLTDWKEVKDIGSAFEYITNNAALSLPYMAITVGSTLAAPVTGGLSLAAPASVYTGMTWNEMEGKNKNAGVAIASGITQAALDRLGLSFIFKKGVGSTKLLNEAVDTLVSRGATREAAKQQVFGATRKELAGFVGDVGEVAKRQIAGKEVFKNFVKAGAIGAGSEGLTEGLQEATGYTSAHLQEGFSWDEFNERVAAGMIAGATLGSAFSTPGAAYETGAWTDLAYRIAPAEAEHKSMSTRYAEEEQQQNGFIPSIQDLNNQARQQVETTGTNVTFQERVSADKERKSKRNAYELLTQTMLNAPALWRGATRNIFTPELQAKSRSARILADSFGGNLQRIFHGSNFEASKHHRVAKYKNMVPIPENFYAAWTGGKRLNRTQRGEVSAQIYEQLQSVIDSEGNFNPDQLPDNAQKPMLIELARKLQDLSDQMYADQAQHNPELGYQKNYLMRYKSLSKKAINKDRHKFQQALMDRFNFTAADAKALTDEILDNTEVNDIDEAFSVVKGGIVPGSHRSRSLNLSEQKEFQDFMEQDLFANVAQASKSAARYTAHRDFIGKNADIIAKHLDNMQAEGVDAETVNAVAAQIQNYLDAESGNYKRPTSDAGRAAMRLQKNFMMFTTLAGLPLATISSFVEAALSMRGLTLNQITRKDGGLESLGRELADTLWSGATEVADSALKRERVSTPTAGKERLRDLGFYEWDVGAATVTGVTETNPWQQQIYENFFKWTGLQGWTNYTRAVRASLAGDYIIDKLDIISEMDPENVTREEAEAIESLRNLGMDVDGLVEAYRGGGMFDPASVAVLEENFREGTFNFVNDAVALPQSANRPLIYQDPRLALFTQFQGFIATFTANHIPKLWGEYVKRGTPAMKYNAFAIMTTMIMLGFASQYLKDLIKYGKTSPYLDNAEYLQRGVRSSGLLGTGERVLDQFFPLYEQRSDGVGDWVWNTTSGESPALSNLKRLGRAGGKLLTGDTGEAARLTAKSTPVVGPFNVVTDLIGQGASSWNFKGG